MMPSNACCIPRSVGSVANGKKTIPLDKGIFGFLPFVVEMPN
jgi:hypothetical protein